MPVVQEKDCIAYLIVPPSSMTDTEYENAVMAIAERQPYGKGMAINSAGSLFVFGTKPNRVWTNIRNDLIPFEQARKENRELFGEHATQYTKDTAPQTSKIDEVTALKEQMAQMMAMMAQMMPKTSEVNGSGDESVDKANEWVNSVTSKPKITVKK
jgi:hypothetical protein